MARGEVEERHWPRVGTGGHPRWNEGHRRLRFGRGVHWTERQPEPHTEPEDAEEQPGNDPSHPSMIPWHLSSRRRTASSEAGISPGRKVLGVRLASSVEAKSRVVSNSMSASLTSTADPHVVVVGVRADDGVCHFSATDPVPYPDAEREVKRWQGRLGTGRVVFSATPLCRCASPASGIRRTSWSGDSRRSGAGRSGGAGRLARH